MLTQKGGRRSGDGPGRDFEGKPSSLSFKGECVLETVKKPVARLLWKFEAGGDRLFWMISDEMG